MPVVELILLGKSLAHCDTDVNKEESRLLFFLEFYPWSNCY